MTARGKEIDFDKCWMGAPMFWSGHDSDTNKRIVREAGLDIVSVQDSDGHFLWLMARQARWGGLTSHFPQKGTPLSTRSLQFLNRRSPF